MKRKKGEPFPDSPFSPACLLTNITFDLGETYHVSMRIISRVTD